MQVGLAFSRSATALSPTRLSPRTRRTASCPPAPRSGATPIRTAPGMLPFAFQDGSGFGILCGLGAGRADVFSRAGGPTTTCPATPSASSWDGKRRTTCRSDPDDGGLEEPSLHMFPEVRLKTYLEMRGADGGPWRRLVRCRPCGWACSTTTRPSMARKN
jgi:glutamate--cysteine ligase